MILVSKKELQAQAEAHETAALILSALVSPEKSRKDNFRLRFPWMALFDEANEKECAAQMLDGAKEFLTSEIALPFVSLVHQWKDLAREGAKANSSDRWSRVESVAADETQQ